MKPQALQVRRRLKQYQAAHGDSRACRILGQGGARQPV
eukprot:CAMPEP_0177545118 /NCGR_PEP_ID=MMETSP0369-20130122/62390_1 /TAXON_ID=447022 ORGANISM="Scrippsiella hangoei-like, Strain SHHI-4" /NCGR_SAMPLE_ID=MMETSP0369 /ASSEMBLY_ACC=CAM_ASM_000364 /LENGTH=37 /DNA_ID= /DNA_START= /DNA_END= /DNA_ORIENTATION=